MKILSNDWYRKSISERIQWYRTQIDSLYDYLVFNEPYGAEHLGYAATTLQNIKYNMRTDLKAATVAGLDNTKLEYLDSVGLAYIELETIGNDFRNWFEALARANKIIFFSQ